MSKHHKSSTGKEVVPFNGTKQHTKVFLPGSLRPNDDELDYVEENKDIDGLLYNLLIHATPVGKEDRILKFMPKGYIKDGKGNLMYRVGKRIDSRTVFSCHMDTVHHNDEPLALLQNNQYIFAAKEKDWAPSILGADDKVGVYIMIRMMEKMIPGLYIFHVGEENGGIGSKYIASETPVIMDNVDRVIAFDRKDYESIITKQSAGMTASTTFADALAKQFADMKIFPPKIAWKADRTGTFTDSSSYRNLVPECTNLSVGYFNQHSFNEHFDNEWLEKFLIPAILKVEWEKLPTERKKGEDYSNARHNGGCGYGSYDNYDKSTEKVPDCPRLVNTSKIYNNWTVEYNQIYQHTDWNKIPVREFSGIPEGCNKTNFFNAMRCKLVTDGMDKFFNELFDFLSQTDGKVCTYAGEKETKIKELQEELAKAKDEADDAKLSLALVVDLGLDEKLIQEATQAFKASAAEKTTAGE